MSEHRRRTTQTILTACRQLRQRQTPAEALLWKYLRNRQLNGFKFRRQHAIDRFIADFYCAERRIIIELDGTSHVNRKDYDAARTETLEQSGYTVIRFTNDEIEQDLLGVLARLQQSLMV